MRKPNLRKVGKVVTKTAEVLADSGTLPLVPQIIATAVAAAGHAATTEDYGACLNCRWSGGVIDGGVDDVVLCRWAEERAFPDWMERAQLQSDARGTLAGSMLNKFVVGYLKSMLPSSCRAWEKK